MTTIKCTRDRRAFDNGHTDFGFTDSAGRKVGYKWQISTVVLIELTDEEAKCRGYYTVDATEPKQFFEVWGQPTRNGVGYGPAFNTVEVAGIMDARRTVIKRIEQARKRDAKKFTVVA